MAQKLLECIGALEFIWPLGRGQKCVNPCKRGAFGGSGMAQKLLGWIGALEGTWPSAKGQKCGNLCKRGEPAGRGASITNRFARFK